MLGILIFLISFIQLLRIKNKKRYYENIFKERDTELKIENLLKSRSNEFMKSIEECVSKLTPEERKSLSLWAED